MAGDTSPAALPEGNEEPPKLTGAMHVSARGPVEVTEEVAGGVMHHTEHRAIEIDVTDPERALVLLTGTKGYYGGSRNENSLHRRQVELLFDGVDTLRPINDEEWEVTMRLTVNAIHDLAARLKADDHGPYEYRAVYDYLALAEASGMQVALAYLDAVKGGSPHASRSELRGHRDRPKNIQAALEREEVSEHLERYE